MSGQLSCSKQEDSSLEISTNDSLKRNPGVVTVYWKFYLSYSSLSCELMFSFLTAFSISSVYSLCIFRRVKKVEIRVIRASMNKRISKKAY